jgi:hypothetical protein
MTTTSIASDPERPADQPQPEPATPKTPPAPPEPRLRWRVVVRTGEKGKIDPSKPSRPLAWHLATCANTELPEAHCPEGRRLIEIGDDPDGHCLLDGVCPRCEAQKRKSEQ